MRQPRERERGVLLPLPVLVVVLTALAAAPRLVRAVTDAADVSAINGLYVALGSPTLPGWTGNGGDPCGERWQGIVCTGSSITGITMNAANLGGQLGSLGNFTSITIIDLSNNNIGGTIPDDLPVTLLNLFLSANQLTGSIPSSLSKLKKLTAMSVNGNRLNGELPDAFDSLIGLVNLDLSSNNLTGVLPPSMKNLASLTTLNIENNLFSGPVPTNLLNIPNFKKDGNPFNTSIAPSASPPSTSTGPAPTPTPAGPKPGPTPASTPPSSPSRASPPSKTTSNSSDGSTARDSTSSSKKHNLSTLKIVGFVLLGVVLFIIIVLLVIFCLSKYEERQSRYDHNRNQLARVHHRVELQIKPSPVEQRDDVKKGPGKALDRSGRELSSAAAALPKNPENQKEHIINFDRTDSDLFSVAPPPPPPPPPLLPSEKVVVNPIVSPEKRNSPPPRTGTPTSATPFSVASLQQYTNSFREENLIRESRLGKVYLAELPDGKLLEVMKIDNANGRISVDDFLERVTFISGIKHPNILELVGYCAEYGQRLLVYNHFSRITLDDALHGKEDTDSALSWNARLQVALGSGKAIEYLHESFQPPIVHQNFEPANVLLDDKFSVCVAECGLAELMPPSSVTQLSVRMHALLNYEAPEFRESGIITERGDVYSFGVVMLELLTGRKPYDSSRPRAEQHLVRWASSQLHDIESLSKMADPSIRGQCSEKALSRFADIISRCIQREPEFRPPISEIVQDLGRSVNATGEESE
ncbi:protein STRUBBELIG-RECEPTOR FAMILY 3-like isoform X2 [Phragmites australis]|uniref:protein STRUBBELIG-RECEPTOR FAMILY 3-like isoform X2 n=1 Tax=Phragmites australis TaxID=29695 RepID=UPI002D78840B|nr:protein STRUBBELIG-RECEPTOR FAMILY 3-like isoform X2 [Phragmites australis]